MATTPTNSTTVSLLNLPVATLATSTDYLILQTTNGTQIIPFGNFNVVRTDIYGNATVVGDLTGNNATYYGGINAVSLTASNFATSNPSFGRVQGWTDYTTITGNYYDSFTIVNGLIVSATPTSVDYYGNPIYTTINSQISAISASFTTQLTSLSNTTALQLTALSADVTSQMQELSSTYQTQAQLLSATYTTQLQLLTSYSTAVFDSTYPIVTLFPNAAATISFPNVFNSTVLLNINNIQTSSFIISPGGTTPSSVSSYYTTMPYVSTFYSSGPNGTTLNVVVTSVNSAPVGGVPVTVRLLATYNAQY